MVLRRTKIIATLGPATDAPGELRAMMEAGLDLARINFSHGQASDHQKRIREVRDLEKITGRTVGIIADLQGPKIRIAKFKTKEIDLHPGQSFVLDAALDSSAGTENTVGIDYKELPKDVHPNDKLLLDDGRLVLQVKSVEGTKIHCEVLIGGKLSNNKGINRQGGGLSAKALTDKDKEDLQVAIEAGVDYVAISFPRSAADIHEAQALIKKHGGYAGVIAKIERQEALTALEAIIEAADAVMVARGDLGVEIGDAELPAVQKHIIHRCRAKDKAVITATQMMESMIHNAIPTRAEVFDVANAVLDGTDAVMLSAETATGEHPHLVIEAMARICLGAEKHPRMKMSGHRVEQMFKREDEAIAMAAMYTANHLDIQGIVALTESGSTPLWMSRIRSGIPIFALTRHFSTMHKVTLYRGVYPVYFDLTGLTRDTLNPEAVRTVEAKQYIKKGDRVILTKGDLVGVHGGANALKIVEVGNVK